MVIRDTYKIRPVRKVKPQEPPTAASQLAQVVASRRAEQAEISKMRLQLEKLWLETQRRIQASRVKFHLARWKMINKAMDD